MRKIAILSGTNRPASRSLHIANHLVRLYGELGTAPVLLDLTQLPDDIFSPSVYAQKPPSFDPWSAAVLGCDGIVAIVPEYNGSFPGILKYFIDLLPFPESFEDRPACLIGLSSGTWGSLRAVEHLQGVFGYRNAHIFPRRVFLPQVHGVLDEGGVPGEDLAHRLRNQAVGFLEFIQKLKK